MARVRVRTCERVHVGVYACAYEPDMVHACVPGPSVEGTTAQAGSEDDDDIIIVAAPAAGAPTPAKGKRKLDEGAEPAAKRTRAIANGAQTGVIEID